MFILELQESVPGQVSGVFGKKAARLCDAFLFGLHARSSEERACTSILLVKQVARSSLADDVGQLSVAFKQAAHVPARSACSSSEWLVLFGFHKLPGQVSG